MASRLSVSILHTHYILKLYLNMTEPDSSQITVSQIIDSQITVILQVSLRSTSASMHVLLAIGASR